MIMILIGVYEFLKIKSKNMWEKQWFLLLLIISLEIMFWVCGLTTFFQGALKLTKFPFQANIKNDYISEKNNSTNLNGKFDYKRECNQKKINNIIYYYDSKESENDIISCNKGIELAGINMDKYFDHKEQEIKVVILNDFEKLGKKNISNAVGITTYPEKVIYILNSQTRMKELLKDKESSSEDIKSTICHEYVHLVIFNEIEEREIFPTSKVPVWLQEGLAFYIENENYKKYELDKYSKLDNLKYADTEFLEENGFEYYLASSVLVKNIIDNYGGEKVFENILDDMEKTKDFYKSFENIIGKTYEEVEEEVLL